VANGLAMRSTGFKRIKLSNKHLAKTFILFYLFIFKAKSKDLADFIN
jgi:hypothetical protein